MNNYLIAENDFIISHWGWGRASVFRDQEEGSRREKANGLSSSLASLKFHIDNNDYFGSLATILSLLAQKAKDSDRKMLEKIVANLMYLQKNYRITERITKN